MITRRIVGLIILLIIIVMGIVLLLVTKRQVSDAESDNMIVEKKDIKGKM